VLPCLTLAHACRQLRAEYLPICRKAPVTIEWSDVPRYLNEFHPSVRGRVQNLEHVASALTILTDKFKKNGQKVTIDFLILMKILHAHTNFRCQFICSDEGLSVQPEEDRKFLECDNAMLQALVRHDNKQWLDDISSGKVVKIEVTPIGLTDEPELRVCIPHDGNSRDLLEDEGDQSDVYDDNSTYLEDVGLYETYSTVVDEVNINCEMVWPVLYRVPAD